MVQHNLDAVSGDPNRVSAYQTESTLATGKLLAETDPSQIDPELLSRVSLQLIAIYDSISGGQSTRNVAAETVAQLARRHSAVLDLVIANAREYARTQHIDDASPYTPNSFDVLASVGQRNARVISFLEDTVRGDWGIPRWAAIEALCGLNDPTADRILRGVVQGQYPPRLLDCESDLRVIETAKWRDSNSL